MFKQMKKIFSVLLVICFLMSVTAAVVSAQEQREHREVRQGEHREGGHGEHRDFGRGEHREGGHGEHRDFGRGEHRDWGWGNDYSHHHWWHGQYYPDCDWVLSPTNQWVWVC